ARVRIDSPEAMQHALTVDIPENATHILIETDDWHIIPLENLIAKYHNTGVELIATARTPEEIELLSNILELGVDSCLLLPSDNYSIEDLLATGKEQKRVDLVELTVSEVKKMGNGDRVCVDTVSILSSGEGLLVGSTSAVMVLVEAEIEESGFVNSRPFRINAGVVASYTMNFEKTNYLSELSTGKSVMVVDKDGFVRKEFIARVKIERRPLIVVKCKYQDREYPIVLQDAETVRLVTPDGSKRVDKLEPGDRVLGSISEKARHFGMAIDEFLEEK
ncbi:MAG: 3-dehydroquinate synthase II, partial [Candidatus Kariarchaeaceae archaeon]